MELVCLQTKEEIAHSVKEELTKSMTSFGFSIIQTLVTDIEPDLKVRAAMNEINAAQRLRCGRTPVNKSHPGQHRNSANGRLPITWLGRVNVTFPVSAALSCMHVLKLMRKQK